MKTEGNTHIHACMQCSLKSDVCEISSHKCRANNSRNGAVSIFQSSYFLTTHMIRVCIRWYRTFFHALAKCLQNLKAMQLNEHMNRFSKHRFLLFSFVSTFKIYSFLFSSILWEFDNCILFLLQIVIIVLIMSATRLPIDYCVYAGWIGVSYTSLAKSAGFLRCKW